MTSIESIVLTHRCPEPRDGQMAAIATLTLTADERTKSRHCFTQAGLTLHLQLPRGTVLHHGDLLCSADGSHAVRIAALPEPVMAVTGSPLTLLQAAYHLGNRHVPVEITVDQLRLAPDPVLRPMLLALGLTVADMSEPFHPESGVYGHDSHG
ncbi:MAG: urease accessory protein UreE [Elainellaceae cyanobacterium]